MQWYLVILTWSYLNSSYWTSLVAQTVNCLPAMRETWVRSLDREDPMEKNMATHSSTLAWKIPWIEEPDRLQSIGLQRFGYDCVTSLSLSCSRCWASFHLLFAIVLCFLALLLFFAKESVQFCSFLSLSFLLVCKSLHMCVCSVAQSCVTFCNPMILPGSSIHGISRKGYWSELPYPSSGDLPDPGIEPTSLVSTVLAGGFFTTCATWEARESLHSLIILFLFSTGG